MIERIVREEVRRALGGEVTIAETLRELAAQMATIEPERGKQLAASLAEACMDYIAAHEAPKETQPGPAGDEKEGD